MMSRVDGVPGTAPARVGLAAEVGPMLRLAVPVVLAELGWMAMGLVDLVMVGRLGPTAIGAVGIGNVLFIAATIVGIGLLLGLDTVVSQAFGAGDRETCHRALVQGLYLTLALSPPLMALIWTGSGLLGAWGVDPAVIPQAAAYLDVIGWSVPFLLLFTAVRRYLQAMNVVVPIAVALVVANLANLVGNWVLVYGRLGVRPMGVVGSGWATFLARGSMFAIVAGAAFRHDARGGTGLRRTPLAVDWDLIRRLLALGWPAAMQLALEIGVFAVATVRAGRLGAVALAAHEIALSVCSLTFMVPLGISAAGSVRVGQALGRGDPAASVRGGWAALLLGTGFMAGSALILTLFRRAIFGVFTADAGVLAVGVPLLVIAGLFQVCDGLQVVATGVLRGSGDTRTPMIVGVLAHWALGLPIAGSLAFAAGWGVFGLWIGLATGIVVTGVALLLAWTHKVRAGIVQVQT